MSLAGRFGLWLLGVALVALGRPDHLPLAVLPDVRGGHAGRRGVDGALVSGTIPPEIEERHRERYRKVLHREMSLAEALAENDADWRRFFATFDAAVAAAFDE